MEGIHFTRNGTVTVIENTADGFIVWRMGETYFNQGKKADFCVHYDTIEQAISATLGNSTLTAEQVREAIFNGSSYASYDGAKYYADGIGMQAIADELNAALGSERDTIYNTGFDNGVSNLWVRPLTCRPLGEWESVSQNQEVRHVWCSECGYEFGMDERRAIPFEHTKLAELPNYCPDCGAMVMER